MQGMEIVEDTLNHSDIPIDTIEASLLAATEENYRKQKSEESWNILHKLWLINSTTTFYFVKKEDIDLYKTK